MRGEQEFDVTDGIDGPPTVNVVVDEPAVDEPVDDAAELSVANVVVPDPEAELDGGEGFGELPPVLGVADPPSGEGT